MNIWNSTQLEQHLEMRWVAHNPRSSLCRTTARLIDRHFNCFLPFIWLFVIISFWEIRQECSSNCECGMTTWVLRYERISRRVFLCFTYTSPWTMDHAWSIDHGLGGNSGEFSLRNSPVTLIRWIKIYFLARWRATWSTTILYATSVGYST